MPTRSSDDADVEAILARRHDNGADYWATPDGRIYVGNPFSTLASLGLLHELGVPGDHEAVAGGLGLVLDASRPDGRVRVAPKAPMYPCYTAEAVRVLCRFGLMDHTAVRNAVERFLDTAHDSGGWRCNFTKFGRGPETERSNPGATLYVLDVLRHFQDHRKGSVVADRAVESLLDHWETRAPAGPCHWGIGTLFLQVEYPFLRYNLFYYLYVLSFFARACDDPRYNEALALLEDRITDRGEVVVERPHRGLKGLVLCARGEPSPRATARYRELRANVTRAGGS